MNKPVAAGAIAIPATLSASTVAAHSGHGVNAVHTHVGPFVGYVAHSVSAWSLIAVTAVAVIAVGAGLRLFRRSRGARSHRS